MAMISNDKYTELGHLCKTARAGNLVVDAFAAELIGEGYPVSKAIRDIIFEQYSDLQLGKMFVEWCDQ